MNERDDFSLKTKEILAKRVGYRCSNPACRKLTVGANDDTQSVTNIGVAAHICAASEGGPRYDYHMTSDERKSIENGIWLCQSCAKLIDSDVLRYTVEKLRQWKKQAEEKAILEIEKNIPFESDKSDIELLKFYIQCFDRPAFRDEIRCEGYMEDFDKAIEDTIIALNTGILRTRYGDILKKSEGKSAIKNPNWRNKFYQIEYLLTDIRRRLSFAKSKGLYQLMGNAYDNKFYLFRDNELEEWFNQSREEILEILSTICREAGLPELHFIRRRYQW